MNRFSLILLCLSSGFTGGLLTAETSLRIEAVVAFTEGPAWHPSGDVFFSDIANNRIMRRDAQGRSHVHRHPSGRANGLLIDPAGRLLACEGSGEGGNRRVTRTAADGSVQVLADLFEGRPLNSPNDLAIDGQGRIYFTDPCYGDRALIAQFDATGRAVEGVYRIDPDGRIDRIIAHEVDRPNGIALSHDDRWLFVADNVNDGPHALGGNRKLWRFELDSAGRIKPGTRTLLFDWGTDRGPDGLAIDDQDRLWVAAGFNFGKPPVETTKLYRAGIYMIAPSGGLLDFHPVPIDMVTNCTFGEPDRQTLYITAGHKLWSMRVTVPGVVPALPPPPAAAKP